MPRKVSFLREPSSTRFNNLRSKSQRKTLNSRATRKRAGLENSITRWFLATLLNITGYMMTIIWQNIKPDYNFSQTWYTISYHCCMFARSRAPEACKLFSEKIFAYKSQQLQEELYLAGKNRPLVCHNKCTNVRLQLLQPFPLLHSACVPTCPNDESLKFYSPIVNSIMSCNVPEICRHLKRKQFSPSLHLAELDLLPQYDYKVNYVMCQLLARFI